MLYEYYKLYVVYFLHYILKTVNVDDKRARQTSERDTFSHSTPSSHSSFNYSIKKMISTSNERQLQLTF